jgi:predicted RNase H-like nuclease (RuvC/YqgF family)
MMIDAGVGSAIAAIGAFLGVGVSEGSRYLRSRKRSTADVLMAEMEHANKGTGWLMQQFREEITRLQTRVDEYEKHCEKQDKENRELNEKVTRLTVEKEYMQKTIDGLQGQLDEYKKMSGGRRSTDTDGNGLAIKERVSAP